MAKFTNGKRQHITPFTKFKFPHDKGPYAPSTIELLAEQESLQTEHGDITWHIQNAEDIETLDIVIPCYAYLATGRFFSTSVAPSEYGDADASDALIAIVYLDEIPSEHLDKLSTGSVVKLTVSMYTRTDLYRVETGNSYSDHIELRLVPMKT